MKIQFIEFSKPPPEFIEEAMNRIESGAILVRDRAKQNLKGQLKGGWKEHGPYKRGYSKKLKRWVETPNATYTARYHGEMVKTIRVVRRPGVNNVWVMAGNYNTWWALQMEYGCGQWRGGAKPFMRPAIASSESRVRSCLENGWGTTEGKTVLSGIAQGII